MAVKSNRFGRVQGLIIEGVWWIRRGRVVSTK